MDQVPGRSAGKLYCPSSVVSACIRTPVFSFTADTTAALCIAPVGSVTVPPTVAVSDCAQSAADAIDKIHARLKSIEPPQHIPPHGLVSATVIGYSTEAVRVGSNSPVHFRLT